MCLCGMERDCEQPGFLKRKKKEGTGNEMAKEYVFRVKPQDYRNNYRVIRIGGRRTLDDLHMAILDAYDFTADHLYMFSPDRKPYDRNGYYSPYDEEGRSAAEAVLERLGLKEGDKWLYLYDFGDDWMFDVTVKSVEEGRGNAKARVLEGKGELVQYPDWEEDDGEGWEDEDEDWLSFGDMDDLDGEDFDEEDLRLAMEEWIQVDVLDESEGMEVLLAGHEPEELHMIMAALEIEKEGKSGKQKKETTSSKQAAAIANALKQRPELLEKLLCAEAICLLDRMSRDRKISLRDCIAARDDLGMMDILGLILLEERDGGILYLTPEAIEFVSHIMEGESGKRMEKKAERERLFQSILQFYQVMEADRLYEMFCALYMEDCSRQEFEEMFLPMEAGYKLMDLKQEKDGVKYLSCLEDPDDVRRILSRREAFQVADYCPKTREELEECRRGDIMPELLDYLIVEKRMEVPDCYRLEELLKAGADLGFSFSMIEDEVREILNENSMRLTKRVREMMTRIMDEYPSASLKGYSMKQFREQTQK